MRKAIFAVMLIGASFAGGAVVNGPGLRWAQAMITSHLNGDDEEAVDEETSPGPEPLAPVSLDPIAQERGNASGSSQGTGPGSAPMTSLEPTKSPAHDAAAADAAMSRREESPRRQASDDPEIALANVPTPLPESGPPLMEPLDPLPPLNDPAPTAAPTAKERNEPAAGEERNQQSAKPPPLDSDTKPRPAADLAGKMAPASGSATDWAEIRRRMAALGVSRYGIEGEPNGRVRFHCVIPLAGRGAVAQQFEGEGNDELQAAELALRRVALWRATENPAP